MQKRPTPLKPIGPYAYGAIGCGLMLFKYLVEYALVVGQGGQKYGLLAFFSPIQSLRMESISNAEPWVGWFILAWSLPFVFIAIWFSMRRALDAGFSPSIALWALCPVVNLVFFVIMSFVPSRPIAITENADAHKLSQQRDTGAWLMTILSALALTLVGLGVSVYLLADYSATMFLSAPVFLGVVSGYSQTKYLKTKNPGPAMLVAVGAMALGLAVVVAIGIDGLICILMAAPIMLPAAIVGGLMGYLIAQATMSGPAWLAVAFILPSSATIEHWLPKPVEYEVVSVVEIDASPDDVWQTVVAFPEIEHPPGWLHRLGVAYPVRARIEGQGVGAVRYCEFSTGDFVEPITVWDQPRRLAFDVQDQPCPMDEISPWEDIHPPHLHGYLTSHHGEFRLIETSDGGTRLEGRTWYSVDMYPQIYWKKWTDQIIHSIHFRVLNHIRDVVETPDQ